MRSVVIAENLFMGHKVRRLKSKIEKSLRTNKGMADIFFIILPRHGEDLLEIVHSSVLMQSYYEFYPPVIVGIAKGKSETMVLLQKMVTTILKDTGGYDFKSFFKYDKEKLCL